MASALKSNQAENRIDSINDYLRKCPSPRTTWDSFSRNSIGGLIDETACSDSWCKTIRYSSHKVNPGCVDLGRLTLHLITSCHSMYVANQPLVLSVALVFHSKLSLYIKQRQEPQHWREMRMVMGMVCVSFELYWVLCTGHFMLGTLSQWIGQDHCYVVIIMSVLMNFSRS